MKHKPEEYKAVKAWGRFLGSLPYYIESQQQAAAREEAPLTAVYYSLDKSCWMTLAELLPTTRNEVQAILKKEAAK